MNDNWKDRACFGLAGVGTSAYGVRHLWNHYLFGEIKPNCIELVNNKFFALHATTLQETYTGSSRTLIDAFKTCFELGLELKLSKNKIALISFKHIKNSLSEFRAKHSGFFVKWYQSPKVWLGIAALTTSVELFCRAFTQKSLLPFLNSDDK